MSNEITLPEGITEKDGWLWDKNKNGNSIEYHGSKEDALKALLSLKNCYACINCYRCYSCSECHNCYYCHDSSGCYRCYNCYDCYRCSDCSECSDCHLCYRCSGCYRCSKCYDSSGCYLCYDCYDLENQNGSKGNAFVIPKIPDIHKKISDAVNTENLDMDYWHSDCGTTHCRAGWAVHLAGEDGRKLEEQTSTAFAAMQIFKASGAPINPARFHDTNEDALSDIKRMAEI